MGGQKVLRAKRDFFFRYPPHIFLVPSTCPLHKLGNITCSVKQRRKTQFESGWGDKSFASEASKNFFETSPSLFPCQLYLSLPQIEDITYSVKQRRKTQFKSG